MLQPSTLQFLTGLEQNNNKPWFDTNRKQYDAAKADFLQLVEQLIAQTSQFDDSIAALKPAQCVFRINRDVRFSKDKSPYKTNMGASISKGGKKINTAGYYFHLEPGKSFAAGGFYMPEPAQLAAIRQEIDYNFKEWTSLVESKAFLKVFPEGLAGSETLVRPPKGYDDSNPAIHYIKMKGYIVSRPIDDGIVCSKQLLKEIGTAFKTMKPMLDFLNRAVE